MPFHPRSLVSFLVLFVVMTACRAQTEPPPVQGTVPELRLVPLLDGLRDDAPGRDLGRIGESAIGKLAASLGLDLRSTENPLLAAQFVSGGLYYVFYKTTENAFGNRPYLIQRIKKTERSWAMGSKVPVEKVTWQVEFFKRGAGGLKAPDQHHGSFGLQGTSRREIVKDYEIGFGTLAGLAEGTAWPFDQRRLFELVQPYQEAPGQYEQVAFAAARRWRLVVAFAADGTWSVASPELGIAAPKRWPDKKAGEPKVDATSRDIVLERGKGLADALVGAADADAVAKVLGAALDDVPTAGGSRLLAFPRSLSANLTPDGKLNTLLTRPGFAGRTREGIRHGMQRTEVGRLLPLPAGQAATAETWDYDGLLVSFDATDRVVRIVVGASR